MKDVMQHLIQQEYFDGVIPYVEDAVPLEDGRLKLFIQMPGQVKLNWTSVKNRDVFELVKGQYIYDESCRYIIAEKLEIIIVHLKLAHYIWEKLIKRNDTTRIIGILPKA